MSLPPGERLSGMQKYILALDQGTTSSRAVLFDATGSVCGIEQEEFPQLYPQPGWVEHAPEDIWTSQLGVAERLLRTRDVAPADIAAIGITNQRETTVVWERATGRPVANAIVWQDRRTASRCDALRQAGHEPTFVQRTGLLLDAYFSGTKLAWLLDNVKGARERARRGELAFGTVDSWLAWQLSGGGAHVTDVSNASRTLLFNIHTLDWDDELLAILDIPRAVLPKVVPSSGVAATTACQGLPPGLAVAGIAGAQQAALFGQACHSPGLAKNTYGTGSFVLLNTGSTAPEPAEGLLTTVAWGLEHETDYALEAAVFVTGAAIQWLRDALGI